MTESTSLLIDDEIICNNFLFNNDKFFNILIRKKFGSNIMTEKHFINLSTYSLSDSEKLILSRSDKGAGVVVLDHSNYISKRSVILDDVSKFHLLGDLTFDNTLKMEVKL